MVPNFSGARQSWRAGMKVLRGESFMYMYILCNICQCRLCKKCNLYEICPGTHRRSSHVQWWWCWPRPTGTARWRLFTVGHESRRVTSRHVGDDSGCGLGRHWDELRHETESSSLIDVQRSRFCLSRTACEYSSPAFKSVEREMRATYIQTMHNMKCTVTTICIICKLSRDKRRFWIARGMPTRAKSLSKMLRIVENERFTFEIDSEIAILDCTLERWSVNSDRRPGSDKLSTHLVADLDKLPKV